MENLYKIPKRTGVAKYQLAGLAFERLKRMTVLPHSANSSKATRTASPGNKTKEKVEKPKVQRLITYSSDLKTEHLIN